MEGCGLGIRVSGLTAFSPLFGPRRSHSSARVASTADTSRLLEEVASVANLAQALLKVIRNKGALGVDGETVKKAQRNVARFSPRCATLC